MKKKTFNKNFHTTTFQQNPARIINNNPTAINNNVEPSISYHDEEFSNMA